MSSGSKMSLQLSSFQCSSRRLNRLVNEMSESHAVVKDEPVVVENSVTDVSKRIFVADLNVYPREIDGDDGSLLSPPFARGSCQESSLQKNTALAKDADVKVEDKKVIKLGKCHSKCKGEFPLESGPDTDADQQCQGVSTSREDKVRSLKAGLVHVARKMPKNAHAHFILGLMYQRLGQPHKAVAAFKKSSEILLQCEEGNNRPQLLSLVQIHHAQCLLQGNALDSSDKELEDLDAVLLKLKESLQLDIRQAAVWNTLGLILLQKGCLQSAISVLSALLALAPDYLDTLASLGIAYLQSGNLELSARCFQDLILKDRHHPSALNNYAALLLCKYGSIVAGAGANASEEASESRRLAANVAKECLGAAVKSDPKAGYIWVNLANAYYMAGDLRSAGKCLEQAARLESNRMATRYAVALHRIKDVERSQDPTVQLCLAANEMASILRDGDTSIIELRTAWAGLAMVHRAQHEIASAFEDECKDLLEVEQRALCTLKQAIVEDPHDVVPWNQLGLYNLCILQFKMSQKYLKFAVACCKECGYTWSNLGISVQLSEDQAMAEEIYKRALSLATTEEAHAILSNIGNLYRQQKRFEHAKTMFAKSLELCPGYAPSYNNLGLVYVAEGRWEDAKSCFEKALLADPLLDAAKSNMMKAAAMSKICMAKEISLSEENL